MFDLTSSSDPRLTIHVLPRDEGLTVRAEAASGETAEAHTVLQHSEDVLRMASQPGFHEDVGRGLFRTLLPGALDDLYRAAYTQATIDGARLALDLHIDRSLARLARYPWELLHDGTRFLLRSGTVTLTRTLDFPALVQPYVPRGPLEILTAAPQPHDQPPLAPIGATIADALANAMRADKVDVAQLFPATWDALLEWLLAGGPDVLHFEGHGDFTRTGRLFFEDARGGVDAVTAGDIGAALYSTALRMVALNASTTSGVMTESTLSSIAPTLIEAGVPVVVAAQYTLPQADAARFWQAVYRALLAGQDVEAAVAAGRHALRRTTNWHAIAHYRRVARVLAPDAEAVPARADTAAPVAAQPGWTVRAGVWLRTAAARPPDADSVARVIGAPVLPGGAAPENAPAVPHSPQPLNVAIRPGPVRVKLDAPGCIVHNQPERNLMFTGDDSLPLWFAVTPRRVGEVVLTFTLAQDGHTLARLAHPLRVHAPGADTVGDEVALLRSHGAAIGTDTLGDSPRPRIRTLHERDSREPAADSAREAGGIDRESRDTLAWDAPRAAREAAGRDAPFSETLDGVQDTLQTGEPPDDDDDPLVRTPVPPARRRAPSRPDDAIDPVPDIPTPPEEDTRLGGLPPPERIPDAAAVRDRGAASLDALPETESLRALSARRSQPGPRPGEPVVQQPAQPPQPAQRDVTHNVPPFIELDGEPAAAPEASYSWFWPLVVLALVMFALITVVLLA